jgi:hypothetical protein
MVDFEVQNLALIIRNIVATNASPVDSKPHDELLGGCTNDVGGTPIGDFDGVPESSGSEFVHGSIGHGSLGRSDGEPAVGDRGHVCQRRAVDLRRLQYFEIVSPHKGLVSANRAHTCDAVDLFAHRVKMVDGMTERTRGHPTPFAVTDGVCRWVFRYHRRVGRHVAAIVSRVSAGVLARVGADLTGG